MDEVQKIKTSELRYRRLFEAAQDGILILDAQTGAITDVNPFLTNMLGYSREEFIQKKLWEVGAFQDIDASREAFKALQMDEYIRYENLPLRSKSGKLIDVEFVSNVYLVGDERVIQCNIRDITKRKQAEDALLKSQALLQEQSVRDHLTGLFNRRYMEETLEREVARTRAELICAYVRKIPLVHEGQSLMPVTLSLGVATFPEHGVTSAEILRMVDAALYRAKSEGRGRVVVAV